MAKLSKEDRQKQIIEYLQNHPFSTDEELAQSFDVSIQTIRLDRVALGIPEVRERMKLMAQSNYNKIKSLDDREVVGELIDVELEKRGLSIMEVLPDMVFEKNKITRGHVLFAQANSLAVALVDAEIALTGSVSVSFIRPVVLGEKVIAKAEVVSKKGNKLFVNVTSLVNSEPVLKGEFIVFALDKKEGLTL